MQRATYLAQLYESVSSIPPDIQQCLLTIAQYGCDPDQVKRWYNLVRSHFGVGEVDSPTELSHQARKPNPRSTSRKAGDAVKAEPPATPAPNHFHDSGSWTSPALHVQYCSGLPDHADSQPPIENLFGPSTPMPQNVVFTGHGLISAHDGFSESSFHPDFLAKSPALPLLSPFDDTFKPPAPELSPRPKTVAPSSILRSSPEQSKPTAKKRKLAQKEDPAKEKRGTMEPPPLRPKRPSVPFRSNEQPPQHLPGPEAFSREESQVSKFETSPAHSSSSQYRPLPQVPVQGTHSPFEDLYIPGQLHQPSQGFLPRVSQVSEPSNTQTSFDVRIADGASEQPPLYQSPYQSVVTSC